MASKRRQWSELSDAYRHRLERGGITQRQYESGASLKAARGHAVTPERPTRAFRNPDLYSDYLRRRVAKGKPVPPGMIGDQKFKGNGGAGGGRRIIGDEIGWPGRNTVYAVVMTRTLGGAARGEPGTITVIRANPKTGDWDNVRTMTYNQRDFASISREAKARGYVVQVVSTTALGVTA